MDLVFTVSNTGHHAGHFPSVGDAAPSTEENKAKLPEDDTRIDIKSVPRVREHPVAFRFSQCGVKVKPGGWTFLNRSASTKPGPKTESGDLHSRNDGWIPILNGVSDEIRGGSLLAIMGPSGSGKSTLLSLLTLMPNNGRSTGAVTLNGERVDAQMLRNFCSFVPQDDHLWPFLTCRETLCFAADFYLSTSYAERQAEVDRLIKVLGLEKCANTLCGNQFIKGLSGGQKRRLSLALGLIKKPLVLFLDEPTSGLDSASASWIMSFLKDYVTQEGIVVICTIHQPSTAIFKQFDSTMLLSGGRVAYVGPAMDATAYFKDTFNADVPKDFSPAEFLLEYINSDFGDAKKKEEVKQILDTWSSKPATWQNEQERAPLPTQGCRTTSFFTQVICLRML
jgi:ABC-type multidrug transport system ATPase subunit